MNLLATGHFHKNHLRLYYSWSSICYSFCVFIAVLILKCYAEAEHVTKVITWKRTTSSRSSSSRNPLNSKDDNDDSGSDFVEDFCMIAGSHSSTLDRVYAWERKLYDEVKVLILNLSVLFILDYIGTGQGQGAWIYSSSDSNINKSWIFRYQEADSKELLLNLVYRVKYIWIWD